MKKAAGAAFFIRRSRGSAGLARCQLAQHIVQFGTRMGPQGLPVAEQEVNPCETKEGTTYADELQFLKLLLVLG